MAIKGVHESLVQAQEADTSRFRQFGGAIKWVVTVLGVGTALMCVFYVMGFLSTGWLNIPSGTFQSIVLGVLLTLNFILVPATNKSLRNKLPWYDIVLIVISVVTSAYIAYLWQTGEAYTHPIVASTTEQVLGALSMLVILEGSRRLLGVPITVMVLFFFIYTMFSNYFPGFAEGRGYSFERVIGYYYLGPEGIYGEIINVVATIVFIFIIFGAFLQTSGGGRFLTNLALSLVGHFRGGPAKVAIIGSLLFGTMSGSAAANVATVGGITIPLMKKAGFKPHFAAAVEAVASTGGQIMPPVMGASAFLMAQFLEIPYVAVCLAALIPALLYYTAEFVMVDLEAAKTGMIGLPRAELPSFMKTIKEGWQFVLPVIALIMFLGWMHLSPQTSVIYALVVLIVVSWFRKDTRVGPKEILLSLENSSKAMLDMGAVSGAMGIVLGSIHLTGLGLNITSGLTGLAGNNLPLLLILGAIASLILGMGLPAVACYIIVVVLIAPALINMGVLPIAAHMFSFYFGIVSFITPPICMATYIAAAIARAPMWKTGWTAVRLGVIAFIVPFIFCYSPALLMIGTPGDVAIAIVAAVIGVVALSAGLSGYLLRPISWLWRPFFIAGAILLIIPGLVTDIIGLALIVIPLVPQVIDYRRAKSKGITATNGIKRPADSGNNPGV
jgi:TRAP transporter 4TM/12TM fusion protein